MSVSILNVDLFIHQIMRIHFENSEPFIRFKKIWIFIVTLIRLIQLSSVQHQILSNNVHLSRKLFMNLPGPSFRVYLERWKFMPNWRFSLVLMISSSATMISTVFGCFGLGMIHKTVEFFHVGVEVKFFYEKVAGYC